MTINIDIRLDEDLNGANAIRRRATGSDNVMFRLCCKSGHPRPDGNHRVQFGDQ